MCISTITFTFILIGAVFIGGIVGFLVGAIFMAADDPHDDLWEP